MKLIKVFLIFSVLSQQLFAQNFKETYTLIQGRNYFKAKSQYFESQLNYSFTEQRIIEAFLFNAFNDPVKSNKIITRLSQDEASIPDSIMMELLNVQTDNFIKLYRYREAKNSIQKLLD